ncbi:hypothetical protein [Streptomyces hokutonensis]|uniref:hypothetical protein n=1 Tax=Streptomyces hokutonensis TaxID=1306990 RepID=UPI0033CF94D2
MSADKAYFTVGATVSTYDLDADADAADPAQDWQLGAAWGGLPPDWEAGIDAAVDLGQAHLYMFRGTEYVRTQDALEYGNEITSHPYADGDTPGGPTSRTSAAHASTRTARAWISGASAAGCTATEP